CAFVRLCVCAFVRLCVCAFVRLCVCALVQTFFKGGGKIGRESLRGGVYPSAILVSVKKQKQRN
uniref:hypothetical protein n=1 Tax=Aeromonas hydrophila TaxID=644 RepID=UPI003D1D53A1